MTRGWLNMAPVLQNFFTVLNNVLFLQNDQELGWEDLCMTVLTDSLHLYDKNVYCKDWPKAQSTLNRIFWWGVISLSTIIGCFLMVLCVVVFLCAEYMKHCLKPLLRQSASRRAPTNSILQAPPMPGFLKVSEKWIGSKSENSQKHQLIQRFPFVDGRVMEIFWPNSPQVTQKSIISQSYSSVTVLMCVCSRQFKMADISLPL